MAGPPRTATRALRAASFGLLAGAAAGYLAALTRPRADVASPSRYLAPRPVPRQRTVPSTIDLRDGARSLQDDPSGVRHGSSARTTAAVGRAEGR